MDPVERGRLISIGKTRHGFQVGGHKNPGDRFYGIYLKMRRRCDKEGSLYYERYGGRGIICLWKSFDEFRKDMHKSYVKHVAEYGEQETTIGRINNDGNYCKENCRWETRTQQARNRKTSRFFIYKGQQKTLPEWAEVLGIDYRLLVGRIYRLKWTFERAVTAKKHH